MLTVGRRWCVFTVAVKTVQSEVRMFWSYPPFTGGKESISNVCPRCCHTQVFLCDYSSKPSGPGSVHIPFTLRFRCPRRRQ